MIADKLRLAALCVVGGALVWGQGCSGTDSSVAQGDGGGADDGSIGSSGGHKQPSPGGEAGTSGDDASSANTPPADGGACVSMLGGHCGGNTTHPCTCAAGLVCTPGDGGLPFGDVGGTCEPQADAGGPGGGPADASGAGGGNGGQGGDAGNGNGGNGNGNGGNGGGATDAGHGHASDGGACGGCSAGESCCEVPGSGGVCTMQCVTGHLCPAPAQCTRATTDAGCVQNVLCVRGDVWDRTLCRCVPAADGGAACQTASDCHGALPQLCMQCSDGGTACAHWACNGGQCETVTCP